METSQWDGTRSLGYVALGVSDVGRSATFYENIVGLDRVGTGKDGEVFLRCSQDHHNIVLVPGAVGLRRLGWQMESAAEVEAIGARARATGLPTTEVPPAECDRLQQDRSIRLVEPTTGVTMEYYSLIGQVEEPFRQSLAKIERLGHVVLRTPRLSESVETAIEALNFRSSDAVEGMVHFLRCFPNRFHHSLAFTRGAAAGLHHVNLMVSEIDDIGRAMTRFKRHDVPVVFGPGRHPPSGSIFLYFLDPDGLTLEYSFGMETFEEVGAREPRTLPAVPGSLDHWGNVPDPRFGTTGEVLEARR
jgi:2,3-dihydroxy-p-cumate/2,3-dihydroxybenzoate 3,4-dioxygenase